MYNISLIKYLYEHGYRQKMICIITGYNQSYISRNCKSNKPYMATIDTANENQLRRKAVVDRILECRVLRKFDGLVYSDQDVAYMRLLTFCLVDKDKIRKLYHSTPMYRVARATRTDKSVIRNFDPKGIGVSEEDWALFMEQFDSL